MSEVDQAFAEQEDRFGDDEVPTLEEVLTGPRNAVWPEDAIGIYFLLLGKKLMYIGKSRSVGMRVAQHLVDRKIAFDSWTWIPLNVEVLDEAEVKCIRALRPSANRVTYMSSRYDAPWSW